MRPEFITFTGVDDRTCRRRLRTIAKAWPVEFAVLFSRDRQGVDPRYPVDSDTISAVMDLRRSAAHLCGEHARNVMARLPAGVPCDLGFFSRIQVNHAQPSAVLVRTCVKSLGCRGIAQSRSDAFPRDTQIDWLFDRSGGRGEAQKFWPPHPGGNRLVGYAGGIGPENVTSVVQAIAATGPFWIDMESGVRTDDWFDLDKVEAVCRAVFVDATKEGQ